MEPDPTPTPRRRRTLLAGVLAVAGLALAVPAAGALAGNDDSSGSTAAETGAAARDKRDCPEHERGGAGREDNSAGSFDESREL